MYITRLAEFVPKESLKFIEKWCDKHSLHLKITRERKSKLGDYRPISGGSHQISINGNLDPLFFFFIFTHEIAHMHCYTLFKRSVAPHGMQWKNIFADLIMESLTVYPPDLQEILMNFSKNPKATLNASPELIKYFRFYPVSEHEVFVEDIPASHEFKYNGDHYVLIKKLKKNYLCQNKNTGRMYRFNNLARVQKITI